MCCICATAAATGATRLCYPNVAVIDALVVLPAYLLKSLCIFSVLISQLFLNKTTVKPCDHF